MGGTTTCAGGAWARLGSFQHVLFAVFRAAGSHQTDLQPSVAALAAKDILCYTRCEEKVKDKSSCESSPKAGWVKVKLFDESFGATTLYDGYVKCIRPGSKPSSLLSFGRGG